ncbi:MAG: hypothetical protein JSR72_05765 [Proteobacteria bacterium]|nr:hypothetical protein [Pseudomonadota bacterium]
MLTNVTEQCVRLGLALALIAVISFSLYQFSGHARPDGMTPVFTPLN